MMQGENQASFGFFVCKTQQIFSTLLHDFHNTKTAKLSSRPSYLQILAGGTQRITDLNARPAPANIGVSFHKQENIKKEHCKFAVPFSCAMYNHLEKANKVISPPSSR
jgi:hypothetical protein